MSTKLTDTQTIEAIQRVLATEEFASDAVAKIRGLLPPTVATSDDMYDAFKAGYDLGYRKGEAPAVPPRRTVIELPDDGDHWGRHDDPEEN